MKIVIPMSGVGRRFQVAGYHQPKPLILVDGKPIIAHVVAAFPGDHEFVFICNRGHLETTPMRQVLEGLGVRNEIIAIEPHKLGPVYAVSQAFDKIDDQEDVMVSYCDYGMNWNFENFINQVKSGDWSGAVPSYIGFHPHLLKPNYYAGVLADKAGKMLEIKEKHCFTEDLMDCFQSAGAYYFSHAGEAKKYFKELMELGLSLNGEYYVSMVYYLYLRDQKKVLVPKIDKFMQWGTPEDLEEYEAWSRLIAKESSRPKMVTDIPLSRESKVVVPHHSGAENHNKSRQYWLEHFNQMYG